MITIVIADDHELVRESIAALLREIPSFKVISQCRNGRQLLKLVAALHPNVAVVDISMPELNGIDAARQIRKISPLTRIVVLSVHTDETYVREMISAGISAYVVKSGAANDLYEAIQNGSPGRVYFSREIAEIAQNLQIRIASRQGHCLISDHLLTQREREVLQLIGEGFSTGEIASKLHISGTTVKTHRNHLMDKLCVRDIAGLTRQAIRLKLINIW